MKRFPEIIKTVKSSKELKLTLQIDLDLAWFDGHFENVKILPGMVAVLWAEEYLRIYYAPNISIKSVDNVKFVHPIFPGSKVELSIMIQPEDKILNFTYYDPSYPSPWIYSHGTLRI
jgi:3-hydroxymyristoyl/3-hydroxydecanoyl-(acyl carrier protein) dehydratase